MTEGLIARFEKQYVAGPTIAIDITLPTSHFNVTSLFGPSGCGKTTLLRCLAGLTRPDKGLIEVDGETWFSADRRISLSPQQRDIGFLFQDYALFPHLTVGENIGFGLRQQSKGPRQQRVDELVDLIGLPGLAQRFPHQLSGGQQQRVALARALARRPKLLLLDEPLSALDTLLREQLRGDLRKLLIEMGIPTLFVTHDRTEAIALSDRIAILDHGAIQQIGLTHDVFSHPKTADLARMIGIESVVPGEVVEISDGLAKVRVGPTELLAVAAAGLSKLVHVCIRGEDVALQKGDTLATSVRNHLSATIVSMTPEGPLVRVGLDCGFELTSLITRPASQELKLAIGDKVTAMLKAPAIHLISR